ncbi:MAG: DUF1697 domain-containing protein [Gaiellales bacterium]
MTRYAALLRGINVGGRARLSMSELREALASLGLEDVVTYIQSGNVVFRSAATPTEIARDLEQRIAEAFSLETTVVLRTAAELASIAGDNPYAARGTEPRTLHVVFLGGAPGAEDVARLDPERSPPDSFTVRGSEIYVCFPNGSGRSKLTLDYFERNLDVRATMRNWSTVVRLVELTRG